MPRTQDPAITEAILDVVPALLTNRSFSELTMDEIAAEAGVGKPAIYRRFANKAALVLAATARMLTPMEEPVSERRPAREALRDLAERAQPRDPAGYAALIGGLMAEHRRHPELIAGFREHILDPRRAVVVAHVREGQRQGSIRADVHPETAVDMLGGAFLARAFAGLPMDTAWREQAFALWWDGICARAPGPR
ncbi:MAG TPA: TetR/AcrR family transcriptional regulator [Baekduia sp.]|nr:TetR/AcrR family transcriptional regulator [Baekduia sp.]